MTTNTQCFQVRGMISTSLAQFKYMMTMSLVISKLIMTISTDSLVAFIAPLFKWQPRIKGDSAIPGKTMFKTIHLKIFSHTLPCLTSPRHAKPNQASPCLALTINEFHTLPNQTLPRQTAAWPYPALPHPARPRHTPTIRSYF